MGSCARRPPERVEGHGDGDGEVLRVGVSGLKHDHARYTIQTARTDPGLELVAIAESEDIYRDAFEQATGLKAAYRTHAELLAAEEFDVLVVCEEFANRGPTAIAGLKAGRHVFAGKPLCTREDELREIAALSREKNLEVGIDFSLCYKWGPFSVPLRDGAIGELVSCFLSGPHFLAYDVRPTWYFDDGRHGGIINDLLGHGLDFVRWVSGHEVSTVLSASTVNKGLPQHPAFEMSGTVHCQMSNDANLLGGVDYFTPVDHDCPWRCWLVGTEGDAIIGERPEMRLRRSGEKEALVDSKLDGSKWQSPFDDFIDHLRYAAEPLRTTEDGFRTQIATLVAQRAAETGETNVTVHEV